jgi:hypothetical protein
MRVLVICRPRAGVDPASDIAPHAVAEIAALRELRDRGVLLEAYSPGGPGAVLILDDGQCAVPDAIASLPLAREGLIDTEVIELHPFAGLGPA